MNRIFKIIYIALFVLVLFIPFMLMVAGIKEERKSTENRKLKEFPKFDIRHLDPFPVRADSFFNDNFPYRNSVMTGFSYFSARYLQKSPLPESVIIGNNGWLFSKESDYRFYCGLETITIAQCDSIADEINRRTDSCAKMGVKYYVAIVPSRFRLYPEHLPHWLTKGKDPVPEAISYIAKKSKAKIIFLSDSLLAHKKDGTLYLEADSHWNDDGAYYGYSAIMSELRKDFPKLGFFGMNNLIKHDSVFALGGIANQMGMADLWPQKRVYYLPKTSYPTQRRAKENYLWPVDFGYPWEFEEAFTNISKDSLPGIMIVRDSYTNSFMRELFASNFGRTTFIWDKWQHRLNYNILLKEKPKIAICILHERFIKNFIQFPETYNREIKIVK